MDIQKLFDAISDAAQDERKKYHLTLGGLIEALDGGHDTPVRFDNGMSPTQPHSYRGYYADLAFERTDGVVTAERLLVGARNCIGRTFEGYKGGDFVMSEDTPLWVASYGCTGEALVGISMVDGAFVIQTKTVD